MRLALLGQERCGRMPPLPSLQRASLPLLPCPSAHLPCPFCSPPLSSPPPPSPTLSSTLASSRTSPAPEARDQTTGGSCILPSPASASCTAQGEQHHPGHLGQVCFVPFYSAVVPFFTLKSADRLINNKRLTSKKNGFLSQCGTFTHHFFQRANWHINRPLRPPCYS